MKCPQCQETINNQASKCRWCGAKVEPRLSCCQTVIIYIVALIIVLIVLVAGAVKQGIN